MKRYPPSPNGKFDPALLPSEEAKGIWVAQRKFNGQRNLVQILKNGTAKLWNRHGTTHKNFQMGVRLQKEILSLNIEPKTDYWLDSELLNAKPGNQPYKGVIVLFDVLQAPDGGKSRYLFNVGQMDRLAILDKICHHPTVHVDGGLAFQVTPHIWMAETFHSNFEEEYNRFIGNDLIEGLVLRRKDAALNNLGLKEYIANWLVRVRKPHKSYNF